jgi:uncharacterized membrane protein
MPSTYDYRQDDRHEKYVTADSNLELKAEQRITKLETKVEMIQYVGSVGMSILLALVIAWLKKRLF